MHLNLAIEEAVSNIILHAYKNYPENEQIEITATLNEDKLVFTITDYGDEFDPTKIENPDITLSTEERPLGGLGIFLIKQLMDEMEYKRANGKNVLIMSKKIFNK
jgi:anti-sigma regulatory factor (Ser/Thr protein kinase)